MYSEEELDAAVQAGVLSAESAAAFRAHVAQMRDTPPADEEHFRLITGFNDIFVVIAVSLLLAALGSLGALLDAAFGGLAVCLASWALAEYFTRRRRMALPSIVLLLTFVCSAFYTAMSVLEGFDAALIIGAGIASAAAVCHWYRFHVPITIAAGAAALAGFAISTLVYLVPSAADGLSLLIFFSGLVVFLLALRWDASDIERRTRRADVAFWLHLLAAPMMIHPAFTTLGVFGGHLDTVRIIVVLLMYASIAGVSLVIDRRALMVSALGYVLYAFAELLKQTGLADVGFAVTALVVGAALLLLSAFWHPSRAFLIARLPARALDHLASVR